MAIKYLYLDDADKNEVRPFVQAVSHSGKIEITHEHPEKYNKNFDELFNGLRRFDGLILDWRLDEYVLKNGEGNKKFNLRAGGLAQEILSRTTEGIVQPMPIVLWSATQNFKGSIRNDYTAQDLFDEKYTKEDIADNGGKIAIELEALVNGYKTILKKRDSVKNLSILLECEENDSYIDVRVKEKFSSGSFSISEVASFILEKLIKHPGLLIDEDVLLSRLGLNKVNSRGWQDLRALLEPYTYNGPFSTAWQRWWARGIEEDWWFSKVKADAPLSILSATDRVAKIVAFTGIDNLVAQTPIESHYHDRFYTICEETRDPLDPIDGVIIDEPQPEPWQERRYISLEIALRRRSETYRHHPTETERLKSIAKNREK